MAILRNRELFLYLSEGPRAQGPWKRMDWAVLCCWEARAFRGQVPR